MKVKIYPNIDLTLLRNNSWALFSAYEAFFQEHNIEYATNSGDRALLVFSDDQALIAAKETSFYPYDMVVNLLRKDLLVSFLGARGFNQLVTKKLSSINDITGFGTFIIKPLVGSAGRSIVLREKDVSFAYKKFANVDELLAVATETDINEVLASNFYCAQQAVSGNYDQITISGAVNGRGDVYFRRNARWVYENDVLIKQIREYTSFANEKALIQNLLAPVRNAAFNVQFVVINNQLYPIDWNFRDPGRTVRLELEKNPVEFKQAMAHQFDIEYTKILANDVWESTVPDIKTTQYENFTVR